MDREMKEEAERIRKENQAFLQKEREQMKSSSPTTSSCEEIVDEIESTGRSHTHEHETRDISSSNKMESDQLSSLFETSSQTESRGR